MLAFRRVAAVKVLGAKKGTFTKCKQKWKKQRETNEKIIWNVIFSHADKDMLLKKLLYAVYARDCR